TVATASTATGATAAEASSRPLTIGIHKVERRLLGTTRNWRERSTRGMTGRPRRPSSMLLPLAIAAQVAASDPSVPFEKYQLPNGLTVILSEDHRLPQVAVDIWYHVGAANQMPGKSGFAHLFEHMMFSGAKHIGPSPFHILEAVGTSAGAMANGTTS